MHPPMPKTREPRFINVRKLAALDLAFHRAWLILAEFAFAVALGCGLGLFVLVRAFGAGAAPSLLGAIVGALLLAVGFNYVPLLLYAIDIVRRQSARAEVAAELAERNVYARKYGVQQFLLVVPLAIPLLAIAQELRQRARLSKPGT